MCQAKPGPRCSPHMKVAREQAKIRMDAATDAYNSALRNPNFASPAGQERLESLMEAVVKRTNEFRRADMDYAATAEGRREKQEMIAELEEKGGTDSEVLASYKKGLERSQKLAARRQEAGKFHNQMKRDVKAEALKSRDKDFQNGAKLTQDENGNAVPEEKYNGIKGTLNSRAVDARKRYDEALENVSRSLETGPASEREWGKVRSALLEATRAENILAGAESAYNDTLAKKRSENASAFERLQEDIRLQAEKTRDSDVNVGVALVKDKDGYRNKEKYEKYLAALKEREDEANRSYHVAEARIRRAHETDAPVSKKDMEQMQKSLHQVHHVRNIIAGMKKVKPRTPKVSILQLIDERLP